MSGSPLPRRFAVVATPRSGSNWLCSMLDSHPDVICHHELFNLEKIRPSVSWHREGRDLGTVAERDADPEGFLARVWRDSAGYRLAGLKLNRGQRQATFHMVLSEPGLRAIVLRRRNEIEAFVSQRIAEATGQWESYPWTDWAEERPRVRIEVDVLRDNIAANEAYYDWVAGLLRDKRVPHVDVDYEDLDDVTEQRRILAFLGLELPAGGLRGATKKQNPGGLRRSIANYEELEAALRGTELAAQLPTAVS